MPGPRIALVLGAGGARGVAHAGVLRRLEAERIPIHTLIGCSVGAIVAAMYGAAGVPPDDMIASARQLTPSSLLAYAVSRWRLPLISRLAFGRAGPIPGHLSTLERAGFESLRPGLDGLGLLAFDWRSRREVLFYGGPRRGAPVTLRGAVAASAAIPGLFPPARLRAGGRTLWLSDAGWHTAVPIERAFLPPVEADRVIAVSLALRVCLRQARRSYWDNLERACGDRLVLLRPRVRGTGILVPRRRDVDRLVEEGERSVDARALQRIRSWLAGPRGATTVP